MNSIMKDGMPEYKRKWRMPVKKIACLLFILLLCCPLAAWAEDTAIRVDIQPHQVRYSFDLPEYSFVYVTYDTANDSGETVLYSDDGHFEGICYLPGTSDAARMGLNVYTLGQRQLMQTRLELPDTDEGLSAAVSAKGAASRPGKAAVWASSEGIHFSFRAPGRDAIVLRCKSAQEWHKITLRAASDYTYSGTVAMPCTFADDNMTVTVQGTGGATLMEESLVMPYEAPAAPHTLKSAQLQGVVVCIDPGHQRTTQVETVLAGPNFSTLKTTTVGMAKGTVTKRMESQLVLEIGMRLRNALMELGANVCMTREIQDTFVGMLDRADIPNNVGADFVLRLHCNSRSGSENVQGIEVYCPLTSAYAQQVADSNAYRAMGETMLRAMQEATGMHKGVCTLNDAYVGNNWSMMPSFLIEMGYMTNSEEDLLLSCPQYQDRLVQGMVQGIISLAQARGLID